MFLHNSGCICCKGVCQQTRFWVNMFAWITFYLFILLKQFWLHRVKVFDSARNIPISNVLYLQFWTIFDKTDKSSLAKVDQIKGRHINRCASTILTVLYRFRVYTISLSRVMVHQWFQRSVYPTIFELQAKTWRNVLDTDDDADWLLGGGKAEHVNWRGGISLKARPELTSAPPEICWARHQDGPQARYYSDSRSPGPVKTHRAYVWAWRRVCGHNIHVIMHVI